MKKATKKTAPTKPQFTDMHGKPGMDQNCLARCMTPTYCLMYGCYFVTRNDRNDTLTQKRLAGDRRK